MTMSNSTARKRTTEAEGVPGLVEGLRKLAAEWLTIAAGLESALIPKPYEASVYRMNADNLTALLDLPTTCQESSGERCSECSGTGVVPDHPLNQSNQMIPCGACSGHRVASVRAAAVPQGAEREAGYLRSDDAYDAVYEFLSHWRYAGAHIGSIMGARAAIDAALFALNAAAPPVPREPSGEREVESDV